MFSRIVQNPRYADVFPWVVLRFMSVRGLCRRLNLVRAWTDHHGGCPIGKCNSVAIDSYSEGMKNRLSILGGHAEDSEQGAHTSAKRFVVVVDRCRMGRFGVRLRTSTGSEQRADDLLA